jgi:hypothetical protein
MNLKKDMFLFIDYANETTRKIQAYTLKDLLAKALDLDEDSKEIRSEMQGISTYEFNTFVNRTSGYCIILLDK